MNIEIKKTITTNVDIKDIREMDSLYIEGVIDELCLVNVKKIQYKFYLDGKKIKQTEC
jgi:protein-disulfide isomerase-like protein with CxxC motif|tara:strand:+ start:720 stop:893 length:174 start_codon:yes stop_codon:yes gene_type:complete